MNTPSGALPEKARFLLLKPEDSGDFVRIELICGLRDRQLKLGGEPRINGYTLE